MVIRFFMHDIHPFWQIIRTVSDFPKSGVDFYDISPLFDGHIDEICTSLIAAIPTDIYKQTSHLVAIESRGFILASLLAAKTHKPLLLIRKQGKLPPPVHQQRYELEYGSDTLEMATSPNHCDVLLVDDVLATGGTLTASVSLCQKSGHTVLGAVVLLDLPKLHKAMPMPIYKVLEA